MSKFISNYINDFQDLVSSSNEYIDHIEQIISCINSVSEKGKKCIIVGNGGSAAIASHFAVDLTKNAKRRCINFNESDLITCFSNDYGYENWVEKAIEYYGDEGDILISISSSGSSKNILNGCIKAKSMNFYKVITLSGMDSDNPLKSMGDINLWVNSKSYNLVENMHQFILLCIVDTIIGKSEYSSNR